MILIESYLFPSEVGKLMVLWVKGNDLQVFELLL